MSLYGTNHSPERSPGTVECHTARFTTQWTTDNVGIIAVGGELDASNATAFADHVDAVQFLGEVGHLLLHVLRGFHHLGDVTKAAEVA